MRSATPLPPFVPGRGLVGNIDVGGEPTTAQVIGGAIFAAWPFVYAVSFSGFDLAMFLVVAALILLFALPNVVPTPPGTSSMGRTRAPRFGVMMTKPSPRSCCRAWSRPGGWAAAAAAPPAAPARAAQRQGAAR